MNKQQQLHQLLQANNLQLSLADLIEYTYHQWSDPYLSVDKAAEHIENNTLLPMNNGSVKDDLYSTIRLGGNIAKANNRF